MLLMECSATTIVHFPHFQLKGVLEVIEKVYTLFTQLHCSGNNQNQNNMQNPAFNQNQNNMQNPAFNQNQNTMDQRRQAAGGGVPINQGNQQTRQFYDSTGYGSDMDCQVQIVAIITSPAYDE
jgi:hypothetical protein